VVDRVKVDLITLDPVSGLATAYEIKRGFGRPDAGKRQKIIDDLIRVRMVLAGAARASGHPQARLGAVRLVRYYGGGTLGL